MKKAPLFVGIFIIGSLFLGGHTTAESQENEQFVYVPDANLRKNMFHAIDNSFYYQQYGLFTKSELANPNFLNYENESIISSLEGIQYANNLKTITQESVHAIDYRPLNSLNNLEELTDYGSNSYSIDFLEKLTNLTKIDIYFSNSNKNGSIDKNLNPIYDLSILDNHNNLNSLRIHSERYAQPIYLNEKMNSYQMVNPIKLSKQFKNAAIQITSMSDYGDFSYENDILTWDNIIDFDSLEEKNDIELNFSWTATYNEGDKSFEFTGTTTIPVLYK